MSYHIQSDKHWRISKSGYSIKTGWSDDSRIVAAFHAPVPFDSVRFERWLEDAQHACDLHNASVDGAVQADARIAEMERDNERIDAQWRDELRIYRETENARIAELEQSVTVRDTEIARLETDLELARRDAERWRKLRAMNWTQKDALAVVHVRSLKLGTETFTHDRLDLAIDARAGNGGGV